MLRSRIKHVLERAIVATRAHRLGRGYRRDFVLILSYHNILPDDQVVDELPLHLARSAFAGQLERLVRTHEVVPLEEIGKEGGTRPRAVITFDDAYRGAVLFGVPELARRGLPSTMFVAPGFIPDGEFWWDTIRGANGRDLDEGMRLEALEKCGGSTAAVEAWAVERGLRRVSTGSLKRAAAEAELAEALALDAGLTLGSHTWSHPNLGRLRAEELAGELSRPLEWLRARFPGRVTSWLAYPYGISSPGARRAARERGYAGALLVEGGGFRGEAGDPYAVPRLSIPASLSAAGFELRLAGLVAR